MRQCKYIVLELAKSEEVVKGLIFAIIVRFEELPGNAVVTYFLERWDEVSGMGDEYGINLAEDIMFEARQQRYRTPEETEGFLIDIRRLNVGPVRTHASGRGYVPEPEDIHKDRENASDLVPCDPGVFRALLDTLLAGSELQNPASAL